MKTYDLSTPEGARWRLYWGPAPLPAGWTAMGAIQRDYAISPTGAWFRTPVGLHVEGRGGVVYALPQRGLP